MTTRRSGRHNPLGTAASLEDMEATTRRIEAERKKKNKAFGRKLKKQAEDNYDALLEEAARQGTSPVEVMLGAHERNKRLTLIKGRELLMSVPLCVKLTPDPVVPSVLHKPVMSDSDSSSDDEPTPQRAPRAVQPPIRTHQAVPRGFLSPDANQQRHSPMQNVQADTTALPTEVDMADLTREQLEAKLCFLANRNKLLNQQVCRCTTMGAVDKFQILQVRKLVKEDLFKKVKFINTTKMEDSALGYLARLFGVKQEDNHDWKATYAHYVRDALNNKCNNVAQDLKRALQCTFWCCL